jgi:septal ring factor EnvC (AmiA/AmiB activator)
MQLKVSSLEAKAVEQEETLSLMAGDLQQEQEHCSSLQREKTLLKDLLQKAETVKASQEAKIKQMNEMLCDMKVLVKFISIVIALTRQTLHCLVYA